MDEESDMSEIRSQSDSPPCAENCEKVITVFALGEREAIGGTDVRQAHQVTRESGRGGTLTSWGLGRVCRKSVLGGGCR